MGEASRWPSKEDITWPREEESSCMLLRPQGILRAWPGPATFHSSNVLVTGLPVAPLYPQAANSSFQNCSSNSATPWLKVFITRRRRPFVSHSRLFMTTVGTLRAGLVAHCHPSFEDCGQGCRSHVCTSQRLPQSQVTGPQLDPPGPSSQLRCSLFPWELGFPAVDQRGT